MDADYPHKGYTIPFRIFLMELEDRGLTVRRAFDGRAVLEVWDSGSPPP